MVLSNVEIRAEITAERLVFDPPVDDDPNFSRIGSSSVDLLLHERLIVLDNGKNSGVVVDPSASGFRVMDFLRNNGKTEIIPEGNSYQMAPNQLVIARTLEAIKLPLHLAARVEGKSSLARLGLSVHVTAPSVHAGFEGPLYLEMNNIGTFPILLRRRMAISQLILEHVGLPASQGYAGQFQRQA
jgi:dCTP deaminase